MRGGQVKRIIRLLLLLQSRRTGATVSELAAETNVSRRTTYRDLLVLQEVGAPLVSEREEDETVWRIMDADKWRVGLPLSVAEVIALHLAAKVLSRQGGEPWSEALSSALGKIDAQVPGKFLQRIEERWAGVSTSGRGAHRYGERRELVGAVVRAVEDQRILEVQYATPGRPRPVARRIHPYGLHVHEQGLYVVGWDELRERVGTFLVDRIRLATVSERRFDRPAPFDFEDWFAEVRIPAIVNRW